MNLTFDQLPAAVCQISRQLETIKNLLDQQNNVPKEPQDELLTIKQAAELLCLTVPTIYGKVSKGELPYMKRSKRLYFSSIELMAYLKAGKKKSNAEIAMEADQYLANKSRRSAK